MEVIDACSYISRRGGSTDRARMDTQRREMANTLSFAGDDAQLANVDLQNALQKQALQTLSNIMKTMHDTAMAIIRNMKG
jgi:hypothetical protein